MADINAAQPGNAGQPGVSPPLPANVAAVVAFLQQMRHTYTEHDERVHVFPLSPADFQKLVAHIFPPNEQLEWGFHTPVPGYNERLFAFLARIQARFRYSGYSSLLEIALAGTVMHRRAREEVPKVFKDRFAAIAIANEDGLLNEDQIAAISDATVCVEFDVRVNVRNTPDSDNVGSVFLGKMTFDALLITPSSGMVFENNFVRDRTPGELEGNRPGRPRVVRRQDQNRVPQPRERAAHPDTPHGVAVYVMRPNSPDPEVHVLREQQMRNNVVTGGATHQGAIELYMHDLDPDLPQGVVVPVPYEAVLETVDRIARRQVEHERLERRWAARVTGHQQERN